jgi:hypothetical protein
MTTYVCMTIGGMDAESSAKGLLMTIQLPPGVITRHWGAETLPARAFERHQNRRADVPGPEWSRSSANHGLSGPGWPARRNFPFFPTRFNA